MRRSVMRRCLKGLGGFPTSTDGFILGPSHGIVGRLDFFPRDQFSSWPPLFAIRAHPGQTWDEGELRCKSEFQG